MKRMKIYMRQLLVGTLNGEMRFFLMLLGITAGLFFFSLGRLAVNSYYDSLLREVAVMPDKLFTTFLVTVIAAVSSSVVLFKVSGYIKENLLSDFIQKCSVEDFVILLMLAIVQNILVALIPIIRYSHMDAVKSLKAD